MVYTHIISYKKILIASLLGTFSLPIGYLVYCGFQKQQKIQLFSILADDRILDSVKQVTDEGSSVAQALKEQFDDEFKQLFNQLQDEFPLPPEAWKNRLDLLEIMKQNDTLFTKNPMVKYQKGDTPLIKKTRELLASYNIDPQAVIIESIYDPENASYAFVGRCFKKNKVIHFIKLNFTQSLKQTPIIKKRF